MQTGHVEENVHMYLAPCARSSFPLTDASSILWLCRRPWWPPCTALSGRPAEGSYLQHHKHADHILPGGTSATREAEAVLDICFAKFAVDINPRIPHSINSLYTRSLRLYLCLHTNYKEHFKNKCEFFLM